MQVAPVQLKNGYKNNTTCISGAPGDIICLLRAIFIIGALCLCKCRYIKALVLVAQGLLFILVKCNFDFLDIINISRRLDV